MLTSRTITISLSVTAFMAGCHHSTTTFLEEKNQCLNEKLNYLKRSNIYKAIVTEFADTFQVMKHDSANFGTPAFFYNKPDDAIFFNQDSSQCLLLVLQKSIDTKWATARVIRGIRNISNWKFELNGVIAFGQDYFEGYKENSFEYISKLARYALMTTHNSNNGRCEINNTFWFSQENRH